MCNNSVWLIKFFYDGGGGGDADSGNEGVVVMVVQEGKSTTGINLFPKG